MIRWTRRWVPALVLALAAAPAAVGAQQVGTISGQVTDAASGQPVPVAQIQVVGTNLGAVANDQGRYTLRGVPARAVIVRVLRVGYQEQTKPATVTAGGTATV